MQTYELNLECPPVTSFRCIKAANSLDIDLSKKLTHKFKIEADITTQFNLGLIVGASGSGKTTLAKRIYGDDCFKTLLRMDTPVIEQFPSHYDYEDCVAALNGAGLSAVTCWLRPAYTLSNGQQARAEIALQLAYEHNPVIIDEFTSVIDRTAAKAMSATVQKVARKLNKQIILLSCHYDIIEWLNPCWVIDCNTHEYIDRRSFFLTTSDKNNWRLKSESATKPLGAILANIII